MTDSSAASRGHGLRRDIDLLEALASDEAQNAGGLGVVRLAQLVGREKTQISRALKALAAEGIVERDPDTLSTPRLAAVLPGRPPPPRAVWCGWPSR